MIADIIAPSPIGVPSLVFPQLYIVAAEQATQSDEEPRTTCYPLETASTEAFNAWLDTILETEDGADDPLFLLIVKGHCENWDIIARWWLINALALHGVEMTKYYFESREEAEKAMRERQAK